MLPYSAAAGVTEKLIIVAGTFNSARKLEQLSIKKNPDSCVDASVFDALNNWKFAPSQLVETWSV